MAGTFAEGEREAKPGIGVRFFRWGHFSIAAFSHVVVRSKPDRRVRSKPE